MSNKIDPNTGKPYLDNQIDQATGEVYAAGQNPRTNPLTGQTYGPGETGAVGEIDRTTGVAYGPRDGRDPVYGRVGDGIDPQTGRPVAPGTIGINPVTGRAYYQNRLDVAVVTYVTAPQRYSDEQPRNSPQQTLKVAGLGPDGVMKTFWEEVRVPDGHGVEIISVKNVESDVIYHESGSTSATVPSGFKKGPGLPIDMGVRPRGAYAGTGGTGRDRFGEAVTDRSVPGTPAPPTLANISPTDEPYPATGPSRAVPGTNVQPKP